MLNGKAKEVGEAATRHAIPGTIGGLAVLLLYQISGQLAELAGVLQGLNTKADLILQLVTK